MHDLPLPDFAAQLHLRRHKFDRVFLQVDDREEDHNFFAMVDNLAYAGFQDLAAWRYDPGFLAGSLKSRPDVRLAGAYLPGHQSCRLDVIEVSRVRDSLRFLQQLFE